MGRGGVPVGNRPTFVGTQRVDGTAAARPRRHVWATTPDGAESPGLLIQWQRRDQDWWALVVWVPEAGITVQQWLPAERLRSA